MEIERLFRQQVEGNIPSSATTAEHYRKVLFGDLTKESVEGLMQSLSGQVILDVASGLNHLYGESLIRRVHEYNKTVPVDKRIHILGIEPKAGYKVGDLLGFKQEEIAQAQQGYKVDESFNEKEYIIPETADQMRSVPDASVDKILSHLFVPGYIENNSKLLSIFEEFYRVLKMGGEIRVYPFHDGDEYLFGSMGTPLGKFITKHFTIHFFRPAEIQTSENRTMVLVKNAKE